jgi:hypothetical protein
MAMMLIALLAVVMPALQTETAQTATMQSDVDRSSELPKASRERGHRSRHRLSQRWLLWPAMAKPSCRC